MSKLAKALVLANILIWGFVGVELAMAAEQRVVCVFKTTKDGKEIIGKDGKPVKDCRKMKIHKKLEGTPVPEKK